MAEGEATASEVPVFDMFQVLSGPEDAIWDDIFDWCMSAVSSIVSALVPWFNNIVSWVTYNVSSAISVIISPVQTAVDWVRSEVSSLWIQAQSIYSLVSSWVTGAYNTIYSAVTSAISQVRTWLNDTTNTIRAWITATISTITTTISTIFTNLWSSISSWFTTLWANTSTAFSNLWTNITTWVSNLQSVITSFFSDLWTRLQAGWEWIVDQVETRVIAVMAQWWDNFLAKVFNFSSWIAPLFNAISAWVTRDVPGSSPWWQGCIKSIFLYIGNLMLPGAGFMLAIFSDQVIAGIKSAAQSVINFYYSIFDDFMNVVSDWAKGVGPISPDLASTGYRQLATVCLGAVGGLVAMTIGGELTVVGSKLGLGAAAAMIYDVTNFKLITGGFVAALTACAIRTPMTYYYNSLLRPNLPKLRDASDFYARDLLPRGAFDKLLGYEGYADIYHDMFADVAYRPVSLFALSSLVTAGVFDETLMADNLRDLGLKPELRKLLLAMYRSKAIETTKGTMGSYAMTRFKEGITTESQFTSELEVLGYQADEISLYLIAGNLAYATDFITDLKTAYQDAVRASNISIDEYRGSLLNLGLVPERVNALVLIEQARIKPKAKLTLVAPPKATYLTDAGKIEVDTLRRKRRKGVITRDQELAGLLMLGMPDDYAQAIGGNDDMRTGETTAAVSPA